MLGSSSDDRAFIVLNKLEGRNNPQWYSVYVTHEVRAWVKESFCEEWDYVEVNFFKGRWIDMSESTLTATILRWK